MTNGTTNMERFIPLLKSMDSEGNRLFRIAISLDGPKKVHDRRRGIKGTFEKAINNITVLGENGINVSIQYTIASNNNFKCIPEFFSELKEWVDYIDQVGFKVEYPVGKASDNIEAFPTPPKYKDMYQKILKWAKRYGFLNKLSNIGYFPPASPEMAKGGWRKVYYLCSAGTYQLTLDANGFITPCTVMRNVSNSTIYNLGNIKHDDLYQIWHKHPLLWKIRLMWPKSIYSSCAFVCSKCPAASLALGKSLIEPDPRCPLLGG